MPNPDAAHKPDSNAPVLSKPLAKRFASMMEAAQFGMRPIKAVTTG